MKKIGITSAGMVIVEMTPEQFGAIERLQVPRSASPSSPQSTALSPSERLAYVRQRITKLNPKKRDGLVSSIRAMFQFNGAITDKNIEEVIAALQKERLLRIDANAKVTYKDAG